MVLRHAGDQVDELREFGGIVHGGRAMDGHEDVATAPQAHVLQDARRLDTVLESNEGIDHRIPREVHIVR